jgi:hypothetical protein
MARKRVYTQEEKEARAEYSRQYRAKKRNDKAWMKKEAERKRVNNINIIIIICV